MNTKISELLNLDDKTALVTGGATGIGASIAETLAADWVNSELGGINGRPIELVTCMPNETSIAARCRPTEIKSNW